MDRIMINVFVVIIWLLVVTRGYMVKEERAHLVMHAHDFTNTKVIDRQVWFTTFSGCSGYDAVAFTVMGINMHKESVEMLVCEGWPFKGATLRVP